MHFSFVWFRSFSVSSVPISMKKWYEPEDVISGQHANTASTTVFFIYYFNCIARNQYVSSFYFRSQSVIFFALISSTSIVKISYHWPLVYVKRAFNPSIINMKNVSCSMNRTCLSMVVHFFQRVYTIQTETGSWNNHHGFVRIPWI